MQSLKFKKSARRLSALAGALALSLALFACGGGSGSSDAATTPQRTRSEVVATVIVGPQPWGVAIKPDGTEAWVGNSGSGAGGGTVSVINLASQTVSATITSGANAADVVFNSTGTRAYVSNYGNLSISDIDTSNNTVTLASAHCGGPLAFAREMFGNRIVFNCDSASMSLDVSDYTHSGRNNVTTGDVIALPATGTWVYVDTTSNRLVQYRINDANVAYPWGNSFAAGLRVLALSPNGQLAVAGSGGAGVLTFLDVATSSVIDVLTIGGVPRGISFNPAGTKLYVVDNTNDRVVVVDVATRTVLETVALTVGAGALRIAISPDGLTAVVTHNNAGTVSILALAP